jgi:hypothetical protein
VLERGGAKYPELWRLPYDIGKPFHHGCSYIVWVLHSGWCAAQLTRIHKQAAVTGIVHSEALLQAYLWEYVHEQFVHFFINLPTPGRSTRRTCSVAESVHWDWSPRWHNPKPKRGRVCCLTLPHQMPLTGTPADVRDYVYLYTPCGSQRTISPSVGRIEPKSLRSISSTRLY